jgi:hypothetical protein
MKTVLITALFCFIIIASCTKTDMSPTTNIVSDESQENATIKQLTNILTAHPWMYQEYYSHYVDEQHKGQRFYDRDSTDNFDQFYKNTVYTFHKNHTFVEYVKYDANTAYNYYGKWQLSDNKPTYLTLNFQSISDEKDSVTLFDNTHLNYFRVSDYHKFYTALVPKQ